VRRKRPKDESSLNFDEQPKDVITQELILVRRTMLTIDPAKIKKGTPILDR